MTTTPKPRARLAALLAALLLTTLLAAPTPAAAALPGYISCSRNCGQTFTAVATGTITQIRILANVDGALFWQLYVTPVDGAGHRLDYRQAIGHSTQENHESGGAWHTISFQSPVPVTAGTQYAFFSYDGDQRDFAVATTPYGGGEAFGGFDTPVPPQGLDFQFEVTIAPSPAPSSSPAPGPSPAPTVTTFADVPADYWAAAAIEQFAKLGITAGCSTDANGQRLFCPDRNVTRAEMAVFLDRAKNYSNLAAPATATFADVPTGYWAYAFIEQFYTLNITTGCGTDAAGHKLYCPDRNVTRAEMAVFLIRAYP